MQAFAFAFVRSKSTCKEGRGSLGTLARIGVHFNPEEVLQFTQRDDTLNPGCHSPALQREYGGEQRTRDLLE